MAKLKGPQFQQVQAALLSGYDEESLTMMVRLGLNQNLAAIAGGSDLTAITFKLIDWAERHGMTAQLIDRAWRYNPDNPELQTLAVDAKGWAAIDVAPPSPPTTEKSQPDVAPTPDGYAYDVFISYSSKDKEWVRETLLPWLEEAGLRVIIDFRDFELGVPSLTNMERAVERSRHTLLILTPNWVNSEWTDFEALLVQTSDPSGMRRRTIPLLRAPCELPARIAMLTYADFVEPDDAQWARLARSLQSA